MVHMTTTKSMNIMGWYKTNELYGNREIDKFYGVGTQSPNSMNSCESPDSISEKCEIAGLYFWKLGNQWTIWPPMNIMDWYEIDKIYGLVRNRQTPWVGTESPFSMDKREIARLYG